MSTAQNARPAPVQAGNSISHEPLSSDILNIMLAHDAWATRSLLNLCRGLSREQFHHEFDIGLGSLHQTLTHIVSVMRRWTDRLAGRTPRPMLHNVPKHPHLSGDAKDRSVDELLGLLGEAERDLKQTAAIIRSGGLSDTVTLDWPGGDGVKKRYTLSKGAVLVHVATHGMHHRAQCLNMLRRLNVAGISDQLPDPSAVDWQVETESPAEVLG